MPQSVLEIAKELTMAFIESGNLRPEDMQDTLQKTHASLLTLKAQEAFGTTAVSVGTAAPVNWRKSITKYAVTCLECGKPFKQLSARHLIMHGLDSRSYRAKYGIPHTQSLAAKETTARRRKITQEMRPWEKTPCYRKEQESDGKAPAASEAEALPDEIEEPSAAAPATAKRSRKSAPKKTARKKRSEG